jgi:hypothetical protein
MFRRSDYLMTISARLAFLLSNYLWFTGNKEAGLYVGIWVPSLIAAGIYLKLILHRGSK